MDSENNQEQLEKDSLENTEQSDDNSSDKKISYEDLEKSYKYVQSELSKANDTLSKNKDKGESDEEIKEKAELIEKSEKIKEEENIFNTFKSDFTTLSEYQLKTVRDLQAINTDKSFEEIAKSYGMLDEAQIERSKGNRAIKGNNIGVKSNETEDVTISEHARRTHNLKTSDERQVIFKKFGL